MWRRTDSPQLKWSKDYYFIDTNPKPVDGTTQNEPDVDILPNHPVQSDGAESSAERIEDSTRLQPPSQVEFLHSLRRPTASNLIQFNLYYRDEILTRMIETGIA